MIFLRKCIKMGTQKKGTKPFKFHLKTDFDLRVPREAQGYQNWSTFLILFTFIWFFSENVLKWHLKNRTPNLGLLLCFYGMLLPWHFTTLLLRPQLLVACVLLKESSSKCGVTLLGTWYELVTFRLGRHLTSDIWHLTHDIWRLKSDI
jgi:hypothetical protein